MTVPVLPALRRPPAPIALARVATSWLFFANGAALGTWLPHIPDAKHTLGLGDMVLGLALLGMAAGSLVGLPLSGVLTARFGSRRTATIAILALLVITPLPMLAPTLPAFAATLALFGVANGAVDVAMNAQAITVEERFGRPILSSFHGLFSAGGLVGAAVASLSMIAGVRPICHLLSAVGVLLAITLIAAGSLLPTTRSPMAAVFRLPRGPLLALGLLALCALLAEGAIGDWAAVYLRDDLRADTATAGFGFAAFALAMATGRFAGDRLVRRFGGPAVLTRAAGVAAAVLVAALVLDNAVAALVGFAAVGLGLANAVPIVFSAAGKVPGTAPELAVAAVSTAGYCGFLSGPPLIGLVAEHFGLGLGLGIVAIALAIVALGGTGAATRRQGDGRDH